MDQYIGKLLDNRYEILECVGTGGMAVVYKARCHRLNRLVAVKILKPELAQDAEFRRRFHDESQAVAMLSHPNIVAVYDVSHSDELDYIVMELIDGITLKQYMQKKGLPLNWREALHFITQIMKALSHAHDRGIIHRDIKPQNIMVLRDGSVKVADFGIARLASAAQSTLTQEALGSVHYISPEQARGSHIDARSDIYSAGVVLYEMIAGRLPYEGDTPVSVAIQHINSIPLPPRDLNPDIPDALETITMKAMASDVEKRYVSADAMLADLEEFRKNPNINFEYTQEDLFLQKGAVDEPTLIRTREDTGNRRPYVREDTGGRRPVPNYNQVNEEPDLREKGKVWPIALAVGIILLFIAGVVWFIWSFAINDIKDDQGTQHVVPDLRGKTIEEVERLQALGEIDEVFTVVQGETVLSSLPAGQIVDQDPSPNETTKGDKIIIKVDISEGAKELLMPNVFNMEYRKAIEMLKAMGLLVDTETETSEEITRDYVIRSDPLANTSVEKGQTVTIFVSLGPAAKPPVTVPSFTNQTLASAQKQAERLKLKLEVTEVEDTHEKGIVFYQSIPALAEVDEGTTIIVYVSSGQPEQTSETPAATPTPTSTPTPTPTPTSTPTPEPPPISGSTTVNADLSGYSDTVTVRVEVDGEVQFNSPINIATNGPTFSTSIHGTGQQKVVIYINDDIVKEQMVDFSQ